MLHSRMRPYVEQITLAFRVNSIWIASESVSSFVRFVWLLNESIRSEWGRGSQETVKSFSGWVDSGVGLRRRRTASDTLNFVPFSSRLALTFRVYQRQISLLENPITRAEIAHPHFGWAVEWTRMKFGSGHWLLNARTAEQLLWFLHSRTFVESPFHCEVFMETINRLLF